MCNKVVRHGAVTLAKHTHGLSFRLCCIVHTLRVYCCRSGALGRWVHCPRPCPIGSVGLRCPPHAVPPIIAQVAAQGPRRHANYHATIGVDRPARDPQRSQVGAHKSNIYRNAASCSTQTLHTPSHSIKQSTPIGRESGKKDVLYCAESVSTSGR